MRFAFCMLIGFIGYCLFSIPGFVVGTLWAGVFVTILSVWGDKPI